MKTLTLLRHAKSSWDDAVARDFDRPLNDKGRRAAATVGRHMRATNMAFDHAVASSALRVSQTIEGVEDGYGQPLGALRDARLYLASVATLLDTARAFPDAAASALLIGHNPGLEDLVLTVVPAADALRREVEAKYPTAALAVLAFDVERWADLAEGGARLAAFIRPRDLDAALGPDD